MKSYALYLSLALSVSCGDADVIADAKPPLPLGDALAYFDAPTSSLVVVRPDGGVGSRGKKLARLRIGTAAVEARSVPRPDGQGAQLLIVDPGAESLHVVRDPSGSSVPVRVGVPLESLDVSPNGRWAVVYQADDTPPSRTLFAFPNTVAVIDLAEERPVARTLRLPSPGARPRRAVFAERLLLRTGLGIDTIELALLFIEGGIVPLDLANGLAGEVVPLDADSGTLPAEVLFSANRGDDLRGAIDGIERAFVRTETGELFVLAIGPSPGRLLGELGALAVSVTVENVVTPDVFVRDIELFFAADGNALLLAAAGGEIVLVDAESGVASRFPQTVFVDSLARFVDPSDGRALALGFARGQSAEELLRLDPLGLDLRRSTGVEELRLGAAIADVHIAAGAGRAVVQYEDGLDLGVLELERGGELLDLRFARSVAARTLAPGGDVLWIAGTSPEDESPHFAEVQLDGALDATDVRLDKPGRSLGRAGAWIWVDHDDPYGSVTFFPAGDLRREAAITFTGLVFTDIYDTAPPASVEAAEN